MKYWTHREFCVKFQNQFLTKIFYHSFVLQLAHTPNGNTLKKHLSQSSIIRLEPPNPFYTCWGPLWPALNAYTIFPHTAPVKIAPGPFWKLFFYYFENFKIKTSFLSFCHAATWHWGKRSGIIATDDFAVVEWTGGQDCPHICATLQIKFP